MEARPKTWTLISLTSSVQKIFPAILHFKSSITPKIMPQTIMGDSDDCSVSVVAFTSCLSRRRRRKGNGRRCPAAAACLSPSWFFARWRKSKDEKKKKKKAPAKVLNGKSPLPLQLVDSGNPSFLPSLVFGLSFQILGLDKIEFLIEMALLL